MADPPRSRLGASFVVASIVVSGIFVVIASQRELSSLENVLLQVFTLGLGLIGSYLLGRESAAKNSRDLMKPHARSAFRRLIALYRGLSRIGVAIDAAKLNLTTDQVASSTLDRLEGMVVEQMSTAGDALEDWQDIVPDEVAELRLRLTELMEKNNV